MAIRVMDLIAAPTLERPPFGLLDTATVLDAPGEFGMLTGEDLYESIACLDIGQSPADPCTIVPANETQTVTVTGAPTGGTFTLTFQGQTTAPIAHNATAATVRSALQALSNVDDADVTTGGSAGGPYTVTFDGQYEGRNVTQMSAAPSLTGGTTPGVSVTTGTQGVGGKTAVTPHAWVDGTKFTGYGLLRCKSIGFGYDDAQGKARAAFDLAESRIIETNVMAQHFGTSGADAVVLTTGTAVPLVDGLALLEGYFRRYYSGVPTIHATGSMASLLTQRNGVARDGSVLRTGLGSLVVAGGGYYQSVSPAGVPAASGEGWMYATGPVVIHRGPLQSARAFNMENNDVSALAERQYLVTTDCLLAAVQVEAVFA